jgi:hypothetical protein
MINDGRVVAEVLFQKLPLTIAHTSPILAHCGLALLRGVVLDFDADTPHERLQSGKTTESTMLS